MAGAVDLDHEVVVRPVEVDLDAVDLGVDARLGPGQYCGELGPLMGFPRSASARAATDVVLTVLSPHEFRERMLHR